MLRSNTLWIYLTMLVLVSCSQEVPKETERASAPDSSTSLLSIPKVPANSQSAAPNNTNFIQNDTLYLPLYYEVCETTIDEGFLMAPTPYAIRVVRIVGDCNLPMLISYSHHDEPIDTVTLTTGYWANDCGYYTREIIEIDKDFNIHVRDTITEYPCDEYGEDTSQEKISTCKVHVTMDEKGFFHESQPLLKVIRSSYLK